MLDNAERCLAGLAREAAADVEETPGVDHAETIAAIMPPPMPPEHEATQVLPLSAPAIERVTEVYSGGPERLDPELLELFIEEAREEIASIARNFPAWERDDADGNALANLRRSFHTLKGSGRMVGADAIGEFCWTVERLFNQLINGTVRRSPAVVTVLQRCIAALPGLLEQLETGTSPGHDIAGLMAELQTVAVAGPPATAAPETQAEEPAAAPAAAPAVPVELPGTPAAMDPVLLDILSREVTGHLAVLRRFVSHCDESAPPFSVPEAVYRSCHTLNGSLAMARVEIGLPLFEEKAIKANQMLLF